MIMTQDFGLAGSLFSTWIVCFLLVCDFLNTTPASLLVVYHLHSVYMVIFLTKREKEEKEETKK